MSIFYLLAIQMSFRWNHSMREPSDRSFLQQGNELVATSIGITANRTMLSCVMNMDAKEYKYYRSQAEILQAFANIYNKPKLLAFRQIQKYTHYHRDVTNTIFLPQALNHGNYNAMSQFLEKLRTNRVGAYVKLSLQESKGYFEKAATLLKPATKIIRERLRFGFVRLKRNMMVDRSTDEKRLILEELDKISSIENKDSEGSKTQDKPKSNIISISYTRIRINPESVSSLSLKKEGENSKYSSRTSKSKARPQQIDINDLLCESHSKEYRFQNVDISRIYSTRVKSIRKVI